MFPGVINQTIDHCNTFFITVFQFLTSGVPFLEIEKFSFFSDMCRKKVAPVPIICERKRTYLATYQTTFSNRLQIAVDIYF